MAGESIPDGTSTVLATFLLHLGHGFVREASTVRHGGSAFPASRLSYSALEMSLCLPC